jgi:hypothetical protein
LETKNKCRRRIIRTVTGFSGEEEIGRGKRRVGEHNSHCHVELIYRNLTLNNKNLYN